MTGRELLDQIDGQLDYSCHLDSNIQHLRHMLEGYRAHIRGVDDAEGCPYSPGSARAYSWNLGVEWAIADQTRSIG